MLLRNMSQHPLNDTLKNPFITPPWCLCFASLILHVAWVVCRSILKPIGGVGGLLSNQAVPLAMKSGKGVILFSLFFFREQWPSPWSTAVSNGLVCKKTILFNVDRRDEPLQTRG